MSHNHQHHHHDAAKNIGIAFFLNATFTVLEIIGGLYVNSVAIVSDAIHDLGDSIALGTAWYLEKRSNQKANNRFTFGYKRLSVISAFINCIILVIGSVIVVFEAIRRLINPEDVDAMGMIIFAIIGIAFNGFAAWKVMRGESLNEKTISWHLIEDVLGWVVVLIGAIVMYFYSIYWLDAVMSIAVSCFIAYNVIGRLKEALYIIAQSVPAHLDLAKIKKEILKLPEVISLHHTHLWALGEEKFNFSTHVVSDSSNSQAMFNITGLMTEYGVNCTTIQVETTENNCTKRARGLDK